MHDLADGLLVGVGEQVRDAVAAHHLGPAELQVGLVHVVAEQLVERLEAREDDGRLPLLPVSDPIERPVLARPTPGTPYDPRQLLCGAAAPGGEWLPGLLDHGSFVETLSDWAKTVVVGRGRLGGMPIGVVVTENRTVEKTVLADPANLESKPVKQMQAGQVWFPDSAYKTAQAIQDLNKGEGLPLLILANWRGFSGGRKDMYEEVLKFGSFIVDQLTQFRQPIIVYIPPHCEIRGGAWVVTGGTGALGLVSAALLMDLQGDVVVASRSAAIKILDKDSLATRAGRLRNGAALVAGVDTARRLEVAAKVERLRDAEVAVTAAAVTAERGAQLPRGLLEAARHLAVPREELQAEALLLAEPALVGLRPLAAQQPRLRLRREQAPAERHRARHELPLLRVLLALFFGSSAWRLLLVRVPLPRRVAKAALHEQLHALAPGIGQGGRSSSLERPEARAASGHRKLSGC